jgi:Tfp pilus assembly protein FimV
MPQHRIAARSARRRRRRRRRRAPPRAWRQPTPPPPAGTLAVRAVALGGAWLGHSRRRHQQPAIAQQWPSHPR